ncbi:hypothetical protein B0H67DRAFT_385481 [Lasiosphaeris hirsuta]|uniref:Uncharacterized protein n=1 Tax=Lasiosphaeris hirsuta TaxID=260670 RepID=A0AA39ZXK9_9PEZI|nr:hypothetical protein B0H67DRAFT_385481 [Lasiosphaeris hirsuta]
MTFHVKSELCPRCRLESPAPPCGRVPQSIDQLKVAIYLHSLDSFFDIDKGSAAFTWSTPNATIPYPTGPGYSKSGCSHHESLTSAAASCSGSATRSCSANAKRPRPRKPSGSAILTKGSRGLASISTQSRTTSHVFSGSMWSASLRRVQPLWNAIDCPAIYVRLGGPRKGRRGRRLPLRSLKVGSPGGHYSGHWGQLLAPHYQQIYRMQNPSRSLDRGSQILTQMLGLSRVRAQVSAASGATRTPGPRMESGTPDLTAPSLEFGEFG